MQGFIRDNMMINGVTSLRLYLPDVIDAEDAVFEKLSEISKQINAGRIYFWTDVEIEAKVLKSFVERYESYEHTNLKSVIRNKFFDTLSEFIWFDIYPLHLPTPTYYRFAYRYLMNDAILDGLNKFQEIYQFVSTDKPIKKQKRNDGEDSNYRE